MPASILQTILSIGPLAASATTTVAHGLRNGNIGLTPNWIVPDRTSPIAVVSADDTEITFRNDGTEAASAAFLVQSDHTIQQSSASPIQHWWQGVGSGAGASLFLGYFGDGSDGDATLSADITTRTEVWYENLDTNGYDIIDCNRIFVRDTLTVRAGSHITRNGADGVGTNGGAQKLALMVGVGGGGGNEEVNGVSVTTTGYGGDGGAGGASPGPGAPGSGGTSSGGDSATESQPRQLPEVVTGHITGRNSGPGYDRIGGGGGGGGGEGTGAEPPGDQDGGGGGAGGDVLVISARHIIIEAGAFIEANGGDGADGETVINPLTLGTGGGGGGGGGVILMCYETLVNNGTIQALGGSGGAGSGLGTDGADGSAGNIFQLPVV